MITLIEALNYKCLRYIWQPLGAFHVLVGPNASGKTTFLDVIAFLGRLVSDGLDAAISERTANFRDLVWGREGESFELAIEAAIPEERRLGILDRNSVYDVVRYQVAIGVDPSTEEFGIISEWVFLKNSAQNNVFDNNESASSHILPPTITQQPTVNDRPVVAQNSLDYAVSFYAETTPNWYESNGSFRLGPTKSALGNLPDDEFDFPITTWLKRLLTNGAQQVVLNSSLLRNASRPGQGRKFKPDGSNLAWVVAELEGTYGPSDQMRLPIIGDRTLDLLSDWIAHLQTALPDIESIRTVIRPEDRLAI